MCIFYRPSTYKHSYSHVPIYLYRDLAFLGFLLILSSCSPSGKKNYEQVKSWFLLGKVGRGNFPPSLEFNMTIQYDSQYCLTILSDAK